MLTLFKRIFGKSKPKPPGPLAPTTATPPPHQTQFDSSIQMAKVEVARLSLKAIAAKFPEDVRALLVRPPDDDATVALPIQTILKQLPTGTVRMSLASLYRQAPAGLFQPLPAGEKRMVEVPMPEVFRHVRPGMLKRRADQRALALELDKELETPVFNNRSEPKPAPAPAPESEEECIEEAAPAPEAQGMRVVAPPTDLKFSPAKASASKPATPAPARPIAAPAKAKASSASAEPVLTLPLAQLSVGWPEEILSALATLAPETTVSVPHSFVAPGLARGRIACTWEDLSQWLTPKPAGKLAIDPALSVPLPLKVLAPAFLAATKSATTAPRKTVTVDETIPALFSGGKPAPEPIAAPEDAAPEPAPTTAAPEANAAPTVAASEPLTIKAEALALEVTPEPQAPEPATDVAANIPDVAPTGAASAPAEEAVTVAAPALSLGEVLGQPGKDKWTPAELVAGVAKLKGIAGTVITLQEGFPVAHSLPDDMNAETFSAFLPQIFSRINQYVGEMKLGDVDDLLFTTRGAHCLIYRLDTIYFGVLGQPGSSLPWNELRLVAAELSRQVKK